MNIEDISKEKEAILLEKLESLIKENKELNQILDKKIKELSEIRIKELKITLKIYQLEELYLKKIKNKLINK